MSYVLNMSKDATSLLVSDCLYESMETDFVDFAFSSGVVSYLLLTGVGRAEKNCKVARYSQILQTIHQMV
jgi:hypothetical protein